MLMLTIASVVLAACVPLPTCSATVPPPCATPTPVVAWDQVADADLAGYEVDYRTTGTQTFTKLADLPCQMWIDDDGVNFRYCPGQDGGFPFQRFPLTPLASYDFCVRAYDTAGNRSIDCSNIITICMPDVWTGGPYN